jgi:Fur family peroxide stress response transcriptional regulator
MAPPPPPEALAERCREAGLKATPQRLAIYGALVATAAHPSPEDLFKAIRPAMPSLSLATVYKTLDALERAGLVVQVAVVADTKRYDANLSPHHHLICTRCRGITDFADPALDEVPTPPASLLGGFVRARVQVQVFGRCAACLEDGPPMEEKENG